MFDKSARLYDAIYAFKGYAAEAERAHRLIHEHKRCPGRALLDFHYLVATPQGVEHVRERHELGLFTDAQYQSALRDAGLEVHHDAEGLAGRGLYLGVRT